MCFHGTDAVMYITALNCKWHTVGQWVTLNCSWHRVSTFELWGRLSLAPNKTPLEYWYSCTALTRGIRNMEQFSFAMLNLQGIEMGALFFHFHHLFCVSADFADLWNPLSLCLLLCLPSVSEIYGFELGTIGAVTIALTPHIPSVAGEQGGWSDRGTLAKVSWLAIRQRVNWKVNIKLGRKWGQ